jgi:hypothetical protein
LVRNVEKAIRTTPALNATGNTVKAELTLTISSEGYATGQIQVMAAGIPALPLRSLMLRSNGNPGPSFVQERLGEYGLFGSGQISGDNARALSDPYTLKVGLRLADFLKKDGALQIPSGLFSPRPIRALAGQLNHAFATVDHPCPAATLEEAMTLIFPQKTKLDRVPVDAHFNNALGQYDATYAINDHTVTATRKLIIAPTAGTCSPTEMNQLRKLAEAVHSDNGAQIFYR